MTLDQVLREARELLAANNIPDAPLEAEVLLRHTLKLDRARLFARLNEDISPPNEEAFRQLIARRRHGEPTAYLTGHREFYGLDFYINPHVLIPRPESELLVDIALELARQRPLKTIADVGTGSGALAVSLALNLPAARIYAIDISGEALEVARGNCQRHGVLPRVILLRGDLLDPLPGPVDLIVANLPYVRGEEVASSRPLGFEPKIALDGGPDGLVQIKRLCRQLAGKLAPDGSLLMEIGQGQAGAAITFLRGRFPGVPLRVVPDLAGIPRAVCLR